MKDFASMVSETVNQIGQAFLVAYYFPSMLFVLVHLYILIPIWNKQTALIPFQIPVAPTIDEGELAAIIWTLLLPLVVGIILLSLNNVLIHVFEGKYWWLKWGFLYPFMRFKQKRWKKLYSDLASLRDEYRRVDGLNTDTAEDNQRAQQQLAGLALQINKAHNCIEKKYPRQILPYDKHRVLPTRFGNMYAIAEEYAYERYGVDAVLFWPHLRSLMRETAPEHTSHITQQKTALDLALNFACILGTITLEAALTLSFGVKEHEGLLVFVVIAGALLFIAFYNSSINAIVALGDLIKISFDKYRFLVLKAFDIQQPKDRESEQLIWIGLAAFVRRGDVFYYPVNTSEKKIGNLDRNHPEI